MRRGRYRTLGATRRGAQRQGTSLFGQARWKPIAVDPEQKFRCLCKKGHKGNAYSNGKDRCKTKEEAYLQKLYGYDKCDGCKFVRAMKAVFKSTKDLRVLDLGTGSCDALRNMLKMGMNATGVESAILSLEDNCPDLLESGAAITTKFDELPFQNSTFDVVFVSHVLEFVPKDSLDDVIAEIARVTKLHVFLALQTPGEGKRSHGKVVDGLELETYYSNIWWRERFAAHGLDLFDIQTHMILERARRKSIKLESSEVAMMLGKAPQADSREFPLIHKVYCLACNYMPLISYMYSPPVVVSQSQYRKKLTMGYTMVLGPSSCNVMRGLLENPPSSMKKAVALQPVPYTVSRDCPDLSNQRLVLEMPPDATRLPFKRHKADLVLSLFHLELMTEGEIKFHLEELKRVTNHRVLFLIHTCGSDFASETCLANAIPGIVTVKPRAWWSDLLVSHGFEAEEISHALQKRQCRAEETKENATASRMGYCDSILEELSAKSTYELTLQDVFPMFVKAAHPEEQGDLGDLIEQHKAKENGEGEDEDSFVDLKSFKENSELDAFEYELALTGTKDRHRSKRYKEEQKIMAKLRKMFPDTPPAPRTAHIYKSRGYNVRSARTQIPHDDEEEGGGRRRL
ncbi:hypothetical protein HOP50_16g78740 [Chloropicon primus]|uniref:Methyltransferase type 11 domain-containing protein n=1 Tax=Chloropicon primus TaxID=1764295 RepID=A0A5B8MZ38_9CHLO|nr:hypothetical protein A3770_16p78440 [Chloropicon primus]UPR04532.1 hypothetical protein HOP50_16g78740 [Chloropicon primus]|eukprot:QDZ25326.1 hypothetical protein A3770_16p78440 [Chloropicon primus]